MTMVMYRTLNVSDLNNNSLNNVNVSLFYSNLLDKNETKVNYSVSFSKNEVARLLQVFMRPLLIILGTYGNAVSFYIMRRGSLKEVSTCSYKAMLAIADTGEYKLNPTNTYVQIYVDRPPCWQRWIWGIHWPHVMKHASEGIPLGFEIHCRHHSGFTKKDSCPPKNVNKRKNFIKERWLYPLLEFFMISTELLSTCNYSINICNSVKNH